MGARAVRVYVTGIECNDTIVDPARDGDTINLWERFSAELVADNERRGCAVTVVEPWWWDGAATGRRHAPDPAAWIGACDAVVVFVGTICTGGAPTSGAQTARLYCVHYDIGVAGTLRLSVLFYSYPNGRLRGDRPASPAADGSAAATTTAGGGDAAGTLHNGIRYDMLGKYVDWDRLVDRLAGAYSDGDDDYSDDGDPADNYSSSSDSGCSISSERDYGEVESTAMDNN